MNRNNRLCSRGNLRRDLRWIEIEGYGLNVGKNRLGAQSGDGAGSGKEGKRRGDYFVTRLYIQSH